MPKKAWVISVDMGYGHQRAAYPLKRYAHERILTANNDTIISEKERKIWHNLRTGYELASQLKEVPLIGQSIFNVYDSFQTIRPFFPFRDLSKPNYGAIYFHKLITKRGLCKSLIDYIQKKQLPIITTHFIPALAAHYHNLKNIYCIVTDSDINRVWVPLNPEINTITYLAPTRHAAKRLEQYGVPKKCIKVTGFPLPDENIGGKQHLTLKKDIIKRLPSLDPKKVYINRYYETICKTIGCSFKKQRKRPLTLTYAVGGAGAQRDIGLKIITSLKDKIKNNEIVVNLVAATHLDVRSLYEKQVKECSLKKYVNKNVHIIFAPSKREYFKLFNKALRNTDILWTKPSELSFYAGLGIAIVLSPPVGAHEKFNQEWLEHTGSAFVQKDPSYVNDWLYYWLETGRFAEAAFEGYTEAPTDGLYQILEEVFS